MVERVALNGHPTRFPNQAFEFLPAHALRSGRSGIVVDLLLDHRSVEIVGPKSKRYLSDLWREHLPVGFHVRNVVEHQATNRNLLDVRHAGGLGQVLQWSVVRVESERNERLESLRLILQRAQPHHVIHAILFVLNVAIEHRAIRLQSDLMGDARRVDPLIAIDLVVADDAAHPVVEDFRAASG